MFNTKKIIPFEKELLFKTKVCEITSISLEHKIEKIEDDLISGIFHISGDYKMTEGSINRENFLYDVNFDIALDSRYDTKNIVIDIDDFTYSIINDEILKVNIDMFIDGEIIKEKEVSEIKKIDIKKEIPSVTLDNEDIKKELDNQRNNNLPTIELEDKVEEEIADKTNNNIFDTDDTNETYATYYVYIVKEEDTIEKIIEKYSVNKEALMAYNDLENFKAGDKVIIPTVFNG